MAPTLVYDGDCAFCTRAASWARSRLEGAIVVVPWQQIDCAANGLTAADVARSAWWLTEGGGRDGGHRAVGRVLQAIGGWWSMCGWVCLTPPMSWVASVGYRAVARFRHRLPGGTAACKVPRR